MRIEVAYTGKKLQVGLSVSQLIQSKLNFYEQILVAVLFLYRVVPKKGKIISPLLSA